MKILSLLSIFAFESLLLVTSVFAAESIQVQDDLKDQITKSASTWLELKVPQAHKWFDGMEITDQNKKIWFFVQSNRDYKKQTNNGPGPNCIAKISVPVLDEESGEYKPGPVVAMIKNGTSAYRAQFSIYTIYSVEDVLRRENIDGVTFYRIGKVSESKNFGHKYKKYQEDGSKITMLKSGNVFPCISDLLCFMPAVFAKWHFKFSDPKTKDKGVIRNQRAETTEVAPGRNILESICISYAIDRLTNPCNSRYLRDEISSALNKEMRVPVYVSPGVTHHVTI